VFCAVAAFFDAPAVLGLKHLVPAMVHGGTPCEVRAGLRSAETLVLAHDPAARRRGGLGCVVVELGVS
jgi:hypothetical protein